MDGKIVYQVRVDSTRVPEDIATAGQQINSGTAALVSLGKQAAEKIGNALNVFFGAQNTSMSNMLSSLTGGFSQLTGSANSAAAALSPLTVTIGSLLGMDFGKLLSFFSQLPAAAAGAGAAVSVMSGVTTLLNARTGKTTTPARYRSGSDYIEKDKYALLHKGEAVLTAAENETLRALGGVEGVSLMAAQKSPAIVMPQEQGVSKEPGAQPQNVNVTVELDGYQMAKVMATATNELSRQLNTRVLK